MNMLKQIFDGRIDVDFFQFLVYDTAEDPTDELPDPTPASAKRTVKRGYEATDFVVCIITCARPTAGASGSDGGCLK
jgi:hypothetical protein